MRSIREALGFSLGILLCGALYAGDFVIGHVSVRLGMAQTEALAALGKEFDVKQVSVTEGKYLLWAKEAETKATYSAGTVSFRNGKLYRASRTWATAGVKNMLELRDRIRSETFLDEIRRQQAEGYHLYGLFADDELVSLAGVRRSHTLSRGEHLFVDDLVTAKAYQRNGFGRELLREIARVAFLQGIPRIYLDSRITAKGFYEAVGFTMQTSIPCWIEVEKLAGTIPQP